MIEVKGLRYRYPRGEQDAVDGIDFTVAKGEIFGFLGPSGAGKSTTQKVLIRLLRDFRGEVRVMGRDIRTAGSAYFERVGVSFELPNHYRRLTGLENLEFFRRLYAGPTEEPRALLARVGLDGDADKPVAEYSKGMQMRLSFIRALLNKPGLLFLDEPTSGLDPQNARVIKDMILARKAAGTTIFLTTHNMTVADELCDRVAFIVEGRLRLVDSPRNLKLKYGRKTVRVEYREDGAAKGREFPLDSLACNQDFLGLLRRGGIETIHTLEATLEDIFLAVTGRALS